MRLYCKFCGEKRLEEDTYILKTRNLKQRVCNVCKRPVRITERPVKKSVIEIE